MTCIAAMTHKQKVYMSSDSAEAHHGEIRDCGTKIAVLMVKHEDKEEPMLIGVSGLSRVGEIVKHVFDPPERVHDVMQYLVGDFSNAFRKCLDSCGVLYKENNEETANYTALIGYKGKLYKYCCNCSVRECTDGIEVVGSGDVSRALLYALKGKKKMTPIDKLQATQQYAAQYAMGVRPPFYYYEI